MLRESDYTSRRALQESKTALKQMSLFRCLKRSLRASSYTLIKQNVVLLWTGTARHAATIRRHFYLRYNQDELLRWQSVEKIHPVAA